MAADLGDIETMESLMCSNPSSELEWELEYYTETEPGEYEFLIWGVSREVDGEIQAWANWTWDDGPPAEDDVYTAFVAVEEGGEWKLCGYFYL